MDVLPVAHDDDGHDDDHREGDLPRVGQRQGAAGQAERQEDLVRGVGHRGERVTGEHREREPLREEGLAEPVAAHRAAQDHALDDTSGEDTTDTVCRAGTGRRELSGTASPVP